MPPNLFGLHDMELCAYYFKQDFKASKTNIYLNIIFYLNGTRNKLR